MVSQKNPYHAPLDLLLECLRPLPPLTVQQLFAPDGQGLFMQEVVDVSRVRSTDDLLDQFSFGDATDIPKPETEEWWVIFQWHPVKKQLIRGEDLRSAINEKR